MIQTRDYKRFSGRDAPRKSFMDITLAHSPDADDAFMFYALAAGRVDPSPLRIRHQLGDIQSLNEAAREGRYEVTAVSFHAYAWLCERYALLTVGASVGDGYGPLVVARRPLAPGALRGVTVLVPGALTTACLALRLFDPAIPTRVVPFDRIQDEVASGAAEAGLLIHEGQLTYGDQRLHPVIDLGAWWTGRTGLPLPLGGNAVRRDLGRETAARVAEAMRESIRYALDHREEALAHALKHGRGLDRARGDRFVGMYVNDWTLDLGERGRTAVRQLLDEGHAAGIVPGPVEAEFW
jgi:1,4-dihydroxy-6-naphthoate synthase